MEFLIVKVVADDVPKQVEENTMPQFAFGKFRGELSFFI